MNAISIYDKVQTRLKSGFPAYNLNGIPFKYHLHIKWLFVLNFIAITAFYHALHKHTHTYTRTKQFRIDFIAIDNLAR